MPLIEKSRSNDRVRDCHLSLLQDDHAISYLPLSHIAAMMMVSCYCSVTVAIFSSTVTSPALG